MKLSELKNKLIQILGEPFSKHRWSASEELSFIKMSYLPNSPDGAEHYEITYDEENQHFYISLHWENQTGHREFENFVTLNEDNEFLKVKQNWQKGDYKEKGLTFYMLEGQEKVEIKEGFQKELAYLIKKTYEKFNPEIVAFYKDKKKYKKQIIKMDKYQQIIKEYIDFCKSDEIWDEAYKWQAISHFQNVWNINSIDFGSMFKDAVKKRANLIHQYPISTLIDGAKLFPNVVKGILNYIFNEEYDINQRFNYFKSETKKLFFLRKHQFNNIIKLLMFSDISPALLMCVFSFIFKR